MTSDEAKQIAERLFTASSGARAAKLIQADESGAAIDDLDFDTVVAVIAAPDEVGVVTPGQESTSHAGPPAFVITDIHLKAIMPNLHDAKRDEYLPHIVKAMIDHEINTPLRAAAFLAQIAHESAELKYMAEIWGPTDQQKKYEPHTELSKNLGNTEKGDGHRFKGRGPIQITGRENYKKYGELLGVDLISNPELAEKAEHAFTIAAAFWKSHGLNDLADALDFKQITHKINGGYTGLADREKYFERAKKTLGA